MQSMNSDISKQLQHKIVSAFENNITLRIVGGNSKAFYGREVSGEILDVSQHQGILNYEPTELVITARAGTPLSIIEKTLAENQQMLGFEPPSFGDNATLGGTLACNFSGPRRYSAGAARDSLLGSKIINGKGETLAFGGEVMKNVAGYDVSRLMAGAMGTLGVLLELSFKILPKPEMETTCVFEYSSTEALKNIHECGQKPLPISATCHYGSQLFLRLSGTERSVNAAIKTIGGEKLNDAEKFWQQLKEQRTEFFQTDKPLWRLSLASDAVLDTLPGEILAEWGGALRWLISEEPASIIQGELAAREGHATLFRHGNPQNELFQPLIPGLKTLHKNLKQAFDPNGILNPGKMYSEF